MSVKLLIISIVLVVGTINCTNQCNAPGSTLPCSGRGFCVEDQCICFDQPNNPHQIVNGQYCECDNLSCLRVNNKMCSGPENGECICNKCICKFGRMGDGCECPISMDSCKSPYSGDGQICSGQGLCVCGECRCDNTFHGEFCQLDQNSYWATIPTENDNLDMVELLF